MTKADMPQETKTFSLQWPIKVKGKDRSELTFRVPNLSDIIAGESVQGGEAAQSAVVLASMCTADVTVDDIKTIKIPDVRRIQRWLVPLLEGDHAEEAGEI